LHTDQRKSYIGLTLNTDQFNMVEASGNQIRNIVSRELIQPFDLASMQSEEEGLDSHIEVIGQLYRRLNTSCRKVGVVINSGMVIVKKVPVALGLDDELIAEQMNWEMDQMIIVSPDQYTIEFERLPDQMPSGNPTYLLVLMQKKILKMVQSIIQRAGLNLTNMDVDIFANIRSLLTNYKIEKEEISLLIDSHESFIDLLFIRQKDYFLSHRVLFKGIKSDSGILTGAEIVKYLIKEIRRLVFGHQLGRNAEDIHRIFLLGGKLAQKISETLPSEISVPVEIVNPFRKINVSPSVTESKECIQFPHRFMPSVGLLLKSIPSLVKA
jgi:Tfp pilus assembly PilM family ATPase